MNGDRLTAAGWLSIINAALTAAGFGMGLLLSVLSRSVPAVYLFAVPASVIGLAITIYIYVQFRCLLNKAFDFHEADNLINIVIACNVVFTFYSIVINFARAFFHNNIFEIGFAVFGILLFIPYCVVHIVFAFQLLKLKDEIFGLLKPYAYMVMAAGICGVTIILSPFALLAVIACYIILGVIFLRVEKELEFV